MALYAIGDLHLSFQADKPMDIWGGVWVDHERQIVRNFAAEVKDEDTLVLVGDHSWGRDLSECEEDMNFIRQLPGRKILTRGNHDMFWDSGKTRKLNELYNPDLYFLQNDFLTYRDYALVATKGYTFEGRDTIEHCQKLINREAQRLRIGLDLAVKAGYAKFIIFLHYPPTNILQEESVFTKIADEYHAEQVVYAHCHGQARFHDSIRGYYHDVKYSLVSGDCLSWHPQKILD
ncbi:MAG: metallophosphoesterase [Bulleidia sp.]|nr:metallophosphoesterase [Bulleidia sp.]